MVTGTRFILNMTHCLMMENICGKLFEKSNEQYHLGHSTMKLVAGTWPLSDKHGRIRADICGKLFENQFTALVELT